MSNGIQELKIIGYAKPKSFEITSGKMMVTDPCYAKGTWCQAELDNVKNGKWFGTVVYSDEADFGTRVASLMVWNDSVRVINPERDFPLCDEHIPKDIGVDSGQASFFDASYYPDNGGDDPVFYQMVCAWTLSEPDQDKMIEAGIYTPTGETYSKSGMSWMDFTNSTNAAGKKLIRLSNTDFEVAEYDGSKLPGFIDEHGFGSFGGNEHGVASSSGYGDGGYNLYVKRDAGGTIVAACIKFIGDEDTSDDEDGED